MEEEELVLLLKQGDEKAFSILYKKYWMKVVYFSRIYITSNSDIEEIVQYVFMKLWENRASLSTTRSLDGYLFISTKNAIFNQYRKRFNEQAFKEMLIETCEDHNWYGIQDELEASELQEQIKMLIEELTPRQRTIFQMSRYEHLSNKQIAEQLSLSERTVEKHINDALRYLKQNIVLFAIFLSITEIQESGSIKNMHLDVHNSQRGLLLSSPHHTSFGNLSPQSFTYIKLKRL